MNFRSLENVRENIDRLDREIVTLMAKRGNYVVEAASFKTSTADVEAPLRVEQVIAKVRGIAAVTGLDPQVAEETYRAMINAFIGLEHAAFRHQTGD